MVEVYGVLGDVRIVLQFVRVAFAVEFKSLKKSGDHYYVRGSQDDC